MHVHLTEHAQWRLGLVPRGPVPAHLYGLRPEKRCQNGWSFQVVEEWRWQIVQDCWKIWV